MSPFSMAAIDLLAIQPILIVSGGALLVLMLDLVIPRRGRAALAAVTVVTLILAAASSVALWGETPLRFMRQAHSMVLLDAYAIFFNLILLTGAALTVLASVRYLEEVGAHHGEYYVLILCAVAGMMTMAQATDLVMIFLGLEVMSIPVYVLAGFSRRLVRSNEAAFKYFLLGAFASGSSCTASR
jgi:NADH-quinone oxidoreductase subunit N